MQREPSFTLLNFAPASGRSTLGRGDDKDWRYILEQRLEEQPDGPREDAVHIECIFLRSIRCFGPLGAEFKPEDCVQLKAGDRDRVQFIYLLAPRDGESLVASFLRADSGEQSNGRTRSRLRYQLSQRPLCPRRGTTGRSDCQRANRILNPGPETCF